MSRDFSTAYKKASQKRELEKQLSRQPKKPDNRYEARNTSILDLLSLMEIKAQQGCFQSFDPKDFGGEYDIVSIPEDGTEEAMYWQQPKYASLSVYNITQRLNSNFFELYDEANKSLYKYNRFFN